MSKYIPSNDFLNFGPGATPSRSKQNDSEIQKSNIQVGLHLSINDQITFDSPAPKRKFRQGESEDARKARLERDRLRKQKTRFNESESEKNARLQQHSQYLANSRANESESEKTARLQQKSQHMASVRANESESEKTARLQQKSQHMASFRANESESEKTARLQQKSQHMASVRANESESETVARLQQHSQYLANTRANESESETVARLQQHSQYLANTRANESESETVSRLQQHSQYLANTRVNESESEKTARLQQSRERMQVRRRINKEKLPTLYKKAENWNGIIPHKLKHIKMDVECIHCGSHNFFEELSQENQRKGYYSFEICCHHGKISLDKFPEYPIELKNLIIANHPQSQNFIDKIRKINSSVSFASMNPRRSNFPANRIGPYCYKVHGQVLHKINVALFPIEINKASYGQLFIIDPEEATNIRANNNPDVEKELLNIVGNIIKNVSPHATMYLTMAEEFERESMLCEQQGQNIPAMSLQLAEKNRSHGLQYNRPQVNEVAAVYAPGADGEVPNVEIAVFPKRDIRIYPNRGVDIKILSSTNQNTDPLCYPLFFPSGMYGWNIDMKQKNNKDKVSRAQYVSYQLMTRSEEKNGFNPIHYGKKLFHQFIVDQAVRIESDRMNFIRLNQKKLCADKYTNVSEALNNRAAENDAVIGKKIILPSSITGTPRWQIEQYQDAMTIVTRTGKPDLFVTVTCNPEWEEIQQNLLNNQKSNDRPDIIARCFNLIKKALLDEIIDCGIFGRSIAHVDVIEFQLRGLPHMHLLVTLHKDDKIKYATDVDKFIFAQLPDKNEDPELFELVAKHMMHGPCGVLNPNAPCMEKGKCTKGFPKEFNESTVLTEDGYPKYARPDNGRFVVKRNIQLDNRWVVSYSPYLLKRFPCHCNVERVSDIQVVKYFYKYVYKGPDKVEIEMKEAENNSDNVNIVDHNEVKRYLDMRHISAPVGCWMIFKFPIQDKSHKVEKLPIHLEGQQTVYWEEDWSEEQIKEAMEKKKMLQAYFDLNNKELDSYDPEAAEYFYYQIPENYLWESKNGKWRKYKKITKPAFGRMYWVDPSRSEEFHLRILLTRLKGVDAKNFISIRSVNGVDMGTYKKACLERGYIRDDTEWINCMEEARQKFMPYQLRTLLARILAHNNPSKPMELWNMFKKDLIEDFLRNNPQNIAEKLSYKDFVEKLISEGKSLNDFPDLPKINLIDLNAIIDCERECQFAFEKYRMLNNEQKGIANEILKMLNIEVPENIDFEQNNGYNAQSIYRKDSKILFVDGPGGTGKTFLYNVINHFCNAKKIKVANMAFSGIAATLLQNGRTLHNRFKLPVPLYNNSNSSISPQMKEWIEIKETEVFIIDEASMVPKHALQIIHNLLAQMMKNQDILGSKIFLFGGDFRQILPIEKNATKAQLINLSLKGHDFWQYIKIYKLTKNMRAICSDQKINNLAFDEWLLKIGNGELNDGEDNVEIPEQLICQNLTLEEEIFQQVINDKDWENLSKRALIAPLNVEVTESNQNVLNMMPHEEVKYYSIDEAKIDGSEYDMRFLTDEFLNSLTPSSLPLHELNLKEHATVMLIRNLNILKGLCNGTRLEIIGLHKNLLECKILTGMRKGEIELIPRITLNLEGEYPFVLSRHQFPVKLSFSMTIHKCQGQTLEYIGVDLRSETFVHGQLYVAISRTKGYDRIKFKLHKENISKKIKNIVYTEVLDLEINS
jgi:hypothetical protein